MFFGGCRVHAAENKTACPNFPQLSAPNRFVRPIVTIEHKSSRERNNAVNANSEFWSSL